MKKLSTLKKELEVILVRLNRLELKIYPVQMRQNELLEEISSREDIEARLPSNQALPNKENKNENKRYEKRT